ncbi:UvrB/UvrC motif-containing protein [Sulfobacillus thermosulfidooxidans]|uniref:Excinuclease ABC subunit B n=1 Tax=Sulfobacillus thermosulfidooxidans TaxID=28034 RepID=A0A1R0IL94_SULTH|nr:UvrB/UvrC motif-containing protein [Sulfobacillus thermosulfidooxidans]OLZ10996.1 excinuclease ABC subunit B [Sulfobacillus thermosulfidooxidans]OLZ14484.1 excinuclease ABC subunit B [Sulfobacillus thermosulfidooxidans]OLZ19227.1 excinuclease ABC subunit B [Sulfobacillus thermosulfidooxidans]PSR25315.1 MAG: excinuclease ABC subunit B [Sulfobacillus thermosulfidooxidans]
MEQNSEPRQDRVQLCQRCESRPASVHMSTVVNGEKFDRFLCEDCARQEGAYHFMLVPQFTIQHVLGGLIGATPTGQRRQAVVDKTCSVCGYSYQQFAETGRLGCDHCYEAFHEELEPLVKRLHGSVEHHGKVPKRGGQDILQQRTLEELRSKMRDAIAREAFEEAAKWRDEIRALEQQHASGGSNHGAL